MDDKRNFLLSNLPIDHIRWLKKKAKKRGLTVTGFVKHWIQTNIDNEELNK